MHAHVQMFVHVRAAPHVRTDVPCTHAPRCRGCAQIYERKDMGPRERMYLNYRSWPKRTTNAHTYNTQHAHKTYT
jgi:hypothetical protein